MSVQNNGVTVADLSDEAQARAVRDFSEFYIGKFRTNDLEILANFKVDYLMNDINSFLFQNRSLRPEQLEERALSSKRDAFIGILTTLDLPFGANGTLLDNTWDDWYKQQFAKLVQGL